jgi:3-dehydroquinate synthase
MAGDKKVLDGQLDLVLMNGMGSSIISSDFDSEKLSQTLRAFATQ